ncbi:MAG: helix-turn-helix transcriptional regulator [Clostridia bacterium]|nr:helix-turn-helix transcriptional regulator [Clostridia bacterium]
MEKKTIGKFISVLRKAKGMTQQELADKLLVSDKTVSKWERDERMPDISLLPAIAEIFGITTDELLRGERNNPEREGYGTEETEAK